MTRAFATGTAFLFGFGIALLPAVGPFVAVLLFISSRIRAHRGDGLWAMVALLYALPAAAGGEFGLAIAGAAQICAGWLIFRAFEQIARHRTRLLDAASVDIGLLVGLGVVIGLHLLQIEAWNFATAKTLAQAIVWGTSPALFGHTVLALGGLTAIVARSRLVRFGALGLSALGILVSGSREAAIGWLVLAVVSAIYARSASWRSRVAELLTIAAVVAVGTGVGPAFGWGKVGFLLQPSSLGDSANLLQGTEVPYGDWWDDSWVTVEAHDITLAGTPLTEYVVTKAGSEAWLRLQQAVELDPGTTYTVSTWLHDDGANTRPGIQGWGRRAMASEAGPAFVLAGAWGADTWSATVHGPGRLLASGVAQREGRWQRVYASFAYTGEEPVAWFVGLVPDAREQPDSTARFAGFQLERGGLSAYEPGVATRGLGLGVARTPYWRAAWEGILERPVLGWGDGAFADRFLQGQQERSRMQVVPAHPHNLFLHVAFERGLIGLAAIALLIVAMVMAAARRRDVPLLALVGAVVLANLFDTTLLYGGVFYPLVAIAGWRIGSAGASADARSTMGRRLVARLGLVVADTAAAAVAYVAATFGIAFVGPWLGLDSSPAVAAAVPYAWLLWPLLSWREGLVPGYGLTPQQELAKQAAVALHAGLFLLAVVVLLPAYAPIPIPLVLLAAALSLATMPLARSIAKRALHAVGVWGRPVIILGAGETGIRIARSLLRSPLEGLHPLAFFDDHPEQAGRVHLGIPVVGTLRDADRYASRHGVGHAIVAIPSLGTPRLRELLDTRGRSLRIVQYVPSLAGLPAEQARASSLDGMLAIEVRNNLASVSNRAAKRAIDVVGSSLGLIVLSPVLVAIGLWIRWDTRGPVLYRSARVGQDGDVFQCFKFRTMALDAETQLAILMDRDPSLREEYERFHKLEDDPRITRSGRLLRRLSLDELPQLLNVVVGDMSLVGPRPYLTSELPMLAGDAELILQAKPGMTGFWQVSERNEVSFRERVEMEAHYVRNWSIWWDIVILARTLPAVLEKRGK